MTLCCHLRQLCSFNLFSHKTKDRLFCQVVFRLSENLKTTYCSFKKTSYLHICTWVTFFFLLSYLHNVTVISVGVITDTIYRKIISFTKNWKAVSLPQKGENPTECDGSPSSCHTLTWLKEKETARCRVSRHKLHFLLFCCSHCLCDNFKAYGISHCRNRWCLERKKKQKTDISGNSSKPITSARGFLRIICGSSVNSLLAV